LTVLVRMAMLFTMRSMVSTLILSMIFVSDQATYLQLDIY
jgi:hypothetical protein